MLTWEFAYGNGNECSKKEAQPRLDYRKGKYKELSEALKQIDWTAMGHMDVERSWKYFTTKLEELVYQFVPPTRLTLYRQHNPPWWHKSLEAAVKRKHKAWKEYREVRTEVNYKEYTVQRNRAASSIRKARQGYEDRLADSLKQAPKRLHGYIRAQQRVKASVGPIKDTNGRLTESNQEAAEVLQSFFKSVFTKENDDGIPTFPDQVDNEHKLCDITITVDQVKTELTKLNPNKAPGPDGMATAVLGACAEQLAEPLMVIFNKTLDLGKLPQDWKKAVISPIFKKGARCEASNFRPVSLTCQACKVMERILRQHIIEHLEENDLISKQQHGFVRKRSCQTNLLESMEDWTRIMDEGKGLDIIFLDYQKAFDTVPHKRLIAKLSAYGLRGNVLEWLKDFLHGRQQQVRVGNSKSSWTRVTSGVPQGSVLGPVMFLLFVNEIPDLVQSTVKMFADDMKIYRAISSQKDVKLLQKDLDTLGKWSDTWLLKFNASKCKVMHCGAGNARQDYSITQEGATETLEETQQERDLGVIIDNSLKPTRHCEKVARKGMSALRLLRSAFSSLNKHNFRPLFNAYVRPHIEYCSQAVGPYMTKNFSSLEKVQRRATKLVRGLKNVPYHERLRRLGLGTAKQRMIRGDMIETYKILTGKLKVDPGCFFERNSNERTRGHGLKLAKKRAHGRRRLR